MDNTVYTRIYSAPDIDIDIDRKEILRYSGVHGDLPELDKILQSCLGEAVSRLTYKVCYREFPINNEGELLDLGFCKTDSRALKKNLEGCQSIVLFAATVGIGIDRLIARYASVSPLRSFVIGALGAERIESLCETFCHEIAEEKSAEGRATRPRFSAGYGDLPLEVQKDIFAVLDCPRKIGLTLNESLLMSPSKSVTAIIGVGEK